MLGTAAGRNVLAGFLVDAWCVGLKDSWGEQNVSRLDFNDLIERVSATMPMKRIDADEAAELVKSAVYFPGKNGFALPAGWTKWAAIFGPIDFNHDIDLSRFTKNGKLLYVGSESFLRRRLKGSTVEQFLGRPDVTFLMGADPEMGRALSDDEDEDDSQDFAFDGEEDDDDGDPVDEEEIDEVVKEITPQFSPLLISAAEEMMTTVNDELHRRHVLPHPRLYEAIGYLASMSTTAAALKALNAASLDREQTEAGLNYLMMVNKETDRAGLWKAIYQVLELTEGRTGGEGESGMLQLPVA
ncbi:MAG TPA: hypothetical protein VFE47_25185 [Tepidisphaeraceae bacterium]|nr:hypothetical protein [Tepidisphaeraceae bacterium]